MSQGNPLTMPWKQAWKVLESWNRLHRVARIDQYGYGWGAEAEAENDETSIYGATCCGVVGHLVMPGIFSRMGLPRCAVCCRIAGVERGGGIPGNGRAAGPMDAWQVRDR